MIPLASNTLLSAPEIARMLLTDESHVRKVIHDVNRHGFESLRPRFPGGRLGRISTDEEARIVAVAGARRRARAAGPHLCPQWDLAAAHAQLEAEPRPDYAEKTARILALYRERPADGVVISFDEKGPENLCPKHGRGWAGRGRPERHRATYTRRQGIRYLVGALDMHGDYLDRDAFGYALADHVRHRNSPAERERRKIEAIKRRQRRAAKTAPTLKLAA